MIDRNDGAVRVDEYYDVGKESFIIVNQKLINIISYNRSGDRVPLLHETRLGNQ